MDAAILRSLLEKAQKLDIKNELQANLEGVLAAISNLAGSPQDTSFQTAFSDSFKALKKALAQVQKAFSPGEFDRLEEIYSAEEFSEVLISQIEKVVNENPASPAVIRDELQDIVTKRQEFITKIKSILSSLDYFHIHESQNPAEKGQVGFKIPRAIFDNNLNGLISELTFLRRFVRLVAESERESPDDIEVGTISTTDPLFWFIVAYGVAQQIGAVAHWALDTWKKVEEIRQLRAQTAAIPAFTAEEADKMFAPKIQEQIDLAINAQIGELSAQIGETGRRHEIENGFRPMLREFLARVERGMTVEVRYLPAPIEESQDPEDIELKQAVASRTLEMAELSSSLVFHRPAGEPVLQLTAANDDAESAEPTKPKK